MARPGIRMDNLMELYRSGLTQKQIAVKFRVTQPTISRKLKTITRQKAWTVKAGFRESERIQALMAELEAYKLRALKAEEKLQRITELAERWGKP